MKLRKAIFDDWEILLKWRNEPITRQNSFTQEEILEQDHKIWFSNSLINPYKEIYILEDNSIPVGTIRSDKTSHNDYILSWNISFNYRGKGYGTEILKLFLKNKKGKFIAKIKPENIASIKMVEKNEFSLLEKDNYNLTFIKIQK